MKNLDLPCRKCGAVDYDPSRSYCRPCAREKSRAWQAAQKAADPDAWARRQRRYAETYARTLNAAWAGRRRPRRRIVRVNVGGAKVRRATPRWLTPEQRRFIRAIYQQAREYTELAGTPYHVDHIVPLRGKTVCGLHVPWNLRVISAAENQRKSARLDRPHELLT